MLIRYDILLFRFLAITSIILFHFNENIFQGGYLGVDILLVITSYLNIYSVNNALKKLSFNYYEFLSRKNARLIPSYLLVLFVCRKYVDNYEEIESAIIFLSNYYYYNRDVDYFHQYDNPSPILHYWCLSLEYQFYFIIPIILKNPYNKAIIFVALLMSLLIFSYNMRSNRSYCYYCLLPRIYQFFLANYIKLNNYEPNRFYAIFAIYIYIIIHIISLLLCSNLQMEYHIIYTIITVFLLNGNYLNLNKLVLLNYFSKISYSLYLVHYPIIIIMKKIVIYKILAMLVNAILLFLICEYILYSYLVSIKNRTLYLLYTMIILASLYIYKRNHSINIKSSFNKEEIWKEFVKNRRSCNFDVSSVNCDKIVFMGDSHIDQWIAGLSKYYVKKGILLIFIKIGGKTDITYFSMNHLFFKLQMLKNILAIILCNFKYSIEFKKDYKFINNYDRYYINLQENLLNYSKNIIVLEDNPHLASPSYTCLNNRKIFCFCILNKNCTISEIPIYKHKNIKKCNLTNRFCHNNICPYIIKNRLVYVDSHHLTPYITNYLSKYFINCIKINEIKRKRCNNNLKCKFYKM